MKKIRAISYGEILWDVFPTGKALGGAPLNVALRLHALGAETAIISRLGTDSLAEETRSVLNTFNMNQRYIQEDDALETGQVKVTLDNSGSASYEISKPVAWDAIGLTAQNKDQVAQSDLFIFGSLAARSEQSRNTLKVLLPLSRFAVFDVNLREPHYQMQHIIQFMKQAQLVKMNEEELQKIVAFLNIHKPTLEDQLNAITLQTSSPMLCVTCGADGAILFKDGKLYTHSGFTTQVIDTVGAGDSFLAGLLDQLFQQDQEPAKALAFACALGALVAGKKGANEPISREAIQAKLVE